MSVVTISGLGNSGPLAVVSVSTAIAESVAVMSVGVRAGVTVTVSVSVAMTVVAVAGLSGSSGLGISLSLRLGISRPLAVVSTVSAIPVTCFKLPHAVQGHSFRGQSPAETSQLKVL